MSETGVAAWRWPPRGLGTAERSRSRRSTAGGMTRAASCGYFGRFSNRAQSAAESQPAVEFVGSGPSVDGRGPAADGGPAWWDPCLAVAVDIAAPDTSIVAFRSNR
jgi:hypothetical protein